jgi:hypothetical protein
MKRWSKPCDHSFGWGGPGHIVHLAGASSFWKHAQRIALGKAASVLIPEQLACTLLLNMTYVTVVTQSEARRSLARSIWRQFYAGGLKK